MSFAQLPYRPCVGLCVINREGKIFAGKRLDFISDAWQMPQGGIDAGEEPIAAAYRELAEETGIDAAHVELVAQTDDWVRYELPDELIGKLWGGRYRGQRQKWYLMRYLGDDDGVNIVQDYQEFSDWSWMGSADLLASIVPFKREIYGTVLSEFEAHLAK